MLGHSLLVGSKLGFHCFLRYNWLELVKWFHMTASEFDEEEQPNRRETSHSFFTHWCFTSFSVHSYVILDGPLKRSSKVQATSAEGTQTWLGSRGILSLFLSLSPPLAFLWAFMRFLNSTCKKPLLPFLDLIHLWKSILASKAHPHLLKKLYYWITKGLDPRVQMHLFSVESSGKDELP